MLGWREKGMTLDIFSLKTHLASRVSTTKHRKLKATLKEIVTPLVFKLNPCVNLSGGAIVMPFFLLPVVQQLHVNLKSCHIPFMTIFVQRLYEFSIY